MEIFKIIQFLITPRALSESGKKLKTEIICGREFKLGPIKEK